VPPDPGYGEPVLGLHLYTWALLVFVAQIVASGLTLVFACELEPPKETSFGWFSKYVLLALGAVIAANAVAVFAEEELHWTLPDDPNSYRLFELLSG
jgi:hypothetical protein